MAIYFHLLLQLTIFLHITFSHITCTKSVTQSYNSSSSRPRCVETERQALLLFKGSLSDSDGRLSSWVGQDCCKWAGVGCNKRTRNIVKLDLGTGFQDYPYFCDLNNQLSGELSPSLLDLNHLNYLNLSCNYFYGSFPSFIGSLQKLKYLDLSHTNLGQMIPPELGNLSNLHYLDLSNNYFWVDYDPNYNFPWASDLNWLAGLTSLKYLNLNSVNLSKASASFPRAISFLPSLSELHLQNCSLEYPISLLSFSTANFSSLSVIDLSHNKRILGIPPWLINVTTLVDLHLSWCKITSTISHLHWYNLNNLEVLELDDNSITDNIGTLIDVLSKRSNITLRIFSLDNNHFSGELGESLGRLTSLTSLVLSHNSISGGIPSSIGRLSFLEELLLSYNLMNGSIPESFGRLSMLRALDLSDNKMTCSIPVYIGELSSLTELDLSRNYWTGKLSEVHFRKLSKLKSLRISSSSGALVFGMAPDWIPPFSLESICIDACVLGPAFPPWIQTQTELNEITMSNVQISDTIPDWFWNLSTRQAQKLDLSSNEIGGMLPYSLEFNNFNSMSVDLSNNNLHGPIPLWSNLYSLILRNNSFSGPIPREIGTIMSSLDELDLSSNCLNGTIPESISTMEYLDTLDLSNNTLSGKLLDKWDYLTLEGLDLSHNNLSGKIPESICSASNLYWLDLSNNYFHGTLSLSLQNCSSLSCLNLGGNRLSGNIPRWKGSQFVFLELLNLGMNRLDGEIPEELCHVPLLHALDLSRNNLSGTIPPCFGNLSSLMVSVEFEDDQFISWVPALSKELGMGLVVKGMRYDFLRDQLSQLNIIDLSSNTLTGEIPEGIANLLLLNTLNFSKNQLHGTIPRKIGRLWQLETLDMSHNYLSGPIPISMASLTMLSHLDLSFNNLSGQIPRTNQFSTFNNSIYEGNPGLCGDPLPNMCYTPRDSGNSYKGKFKKGKGRNKYINNMFWYGMSLGLGFIMGFWGLVGSLVFKRSWRISYFKFFHGVKDRLYVYIKVKIAGFKQIIQRGGN